MRLRRLPSNSRQSHAREARLTVYAVRSPEDFERKAKGPVCPALLRRTVPFAYVPPRPLSSEPNSFQRPSWNRISLTCESGNGSLPDVFSLTPGIMNGFVQFMCRTALRSFARDGVLPESPSTFATSHAFAKP